MHMTHPPYQDAPPMLARLVPGHILLCRDQSLGQAMDTGLLAQAEILAAQTDPAHWLPYVLRPVNNWYLVQCALQ